MKLYTSFGPNPAVVTAFLLQKGQSVETVMLDIRQAESRREPYIIWNPAGGMPLLELDDGQFVAESTAICEYFDETLSGPRLLGDTPDERAIARMWLRRVDIMYVQRSSDGWRHAEGIEVVRPYMHVVPHAAADYKLMADQALAWFDRHAGPGDFLAGARLTLADILLFAWHEFGVMGGKTVDPSLTWIAGWRARMAAQPLAEAIRMPPAA